MPDVDKTDPVEDQDIVEESTNEDPDKNQENEEESDENKDLAEDKETDDKTDDDTEDQEFYESEAAYLQDKGIEGIENIDDLVERYKQAQSHPLEHETPPKQPQPQQTADEQESVFGRDIVAEHIDGLIKSGRITQDNATNYRAMAEVLDGPLNGMIKKQEAVLNLLAQNLTNAMDGLRAGSWVRFTRKGYVPEERLGTIRKQLDSRLNAMGGVDYEAAFREMAIHDPDLFKGYAAKTFAPEKKGGKSLSRFTSGRRSAPATPPGMSKFRPYLEPGGNLDKKKLARLSIKKQSEVVDGWLAYLEKQRK